MVVSLYVAPDTGVDLGIRSGIRFTIIGQIFLVQTISRSLVMETFEYRTFFLV